MTLSPTAGFSGKTVIVTGASAGIGRALCHLLTTAGAQLVVNARNEVRLNDIAEDLSRIGKSPLVIAGDVSDESVVQRLADETAANFGRIDVLVNNAGGSTHQLPFEEIDNTRLMDTLRANLNAAFLLSRAVIPIMQQQSYGRIVNVSSLAGRQHSVLGAADYAAAKAGMLGLTRQLAWNVGPHGITVNAVAPGVTASERVAAKWDRQSSDYQSETLARIPLRRLGEPLEIARAIAFLASDHASYITGATLDVNGGVGMQ